MRGYSAAEHSSPLRNACVILKTCLATANRCAGCDRCAADARCGTAATRCAFRVFLAREFTRKRERRIGRKVLWEVIQIPPSRQCHAAHLCLTTARRCDKQGGNACQPSSIGSHLPLAPNNPTQCPARPRVRIVVVPVVSVACIRQLQQNWKILRERKNRHAILRVTS